MKPTLPQTILLLLLAGALSSFPLETFAQETDKPVTELIQDLLADEKQVRRDAAESLSNLGPKAAPAVSALINALDDGDTQVWFHSITALARIGEAAKPAIPALLDDLDGSSRRGVNAKWYRSAVALGGMGASALPELRQGLKNGSPQVRAGVAAALGWLEAEAAPAIPDLISLLGDDSDLVRTHTAETLGKIGTPALTALKEVLESEDHQQRLSSLVALQALGAEATSLADTVVTAFESSSAPDLRAQALRTLRAFEIEPEAQLRILSPLVAHTDDTIRHEVANTLLLLPPTIAVPALAELLQATDAFWPQWAADQLGRIGPDAADTIPKLVALGQTGEPAESRQGFLDAIANMGPEATPFLFQELAAIPSSDITPDHWTVRCFGAYGIPGLAQLKRGLQHEATPVRLASLYGIQRLGADGRDATTRIERTLRDSNPQIRSASLLSLMAIARDPNRYQADVQRLLNDDAPIARQAAAESVPHLSDPTPAMINRLGELLTDPESGIRLASTRALSAIGPDADSQAAGVAALLVESDPTIQTAAVEALGSLEIAPALAVRQVAHLADQGEGALKLAAIRSLGVVGGDDPRVADVYRSAVKSESEEIREAAVSGYHRVVEDPSEVFDVYMVALNDDATPVRVSAAKRVGRLEEAAIPATKRLLELLSDRQNFTIFLDALKQIPADESLLDDYIEGLDNRNPAVRSYVIQQLGDLEEAARPAVQKLERLARRDRYSFIKSRARTALESITGNEYPDDDDDDD